MAFSAPNSRQTVKFLFAAILASVLLLVSWLSYTATVIFLVIAPALVFFSPILVPAGIVTSLVDSGFILSGGLAVAALLALSWIWKHVPRKRLFLSDQQEYALKRIENTAGEVNDENGEEEEDEDEKEEGEKKKKAEEATETSEKNEW